MHDLQRFSTPPPGDVLSCRHVDAYAYARCTDMIRTLHIEKVWSGLSYTHCACEEELFMQVWMLVAREEGEDNLYSICKSLNPSL